MNIAKWENADRYARQTEVVKQALATSDHSIDQLFRLMRQTGEAAIYLSGTRLDSDFCFGSREVGILLSVLPEDTHAFTPGYHPGSTEVYITFQGGLVMECLEEGTVVHKTVEANHVLILPSGQCHRVRSAGQGEAASVIVKTNLTAKPSVIRCDDCTYYSDKTACPLHQRWNRELRVES
jgi:mannose-6-phosphate isomerase-like protein (cupin superfamily)